jgi:aminoglycoside phosphotransferase (APT) family kinase protein
LNSVQPDPSDAAATATTTALPFDSGALERHLAQHIAGFRGPLTVTPLLGGQSNPTYVLNAGTARYVMRTKPGPVAKLLPSAHAIEREFRVMAALANTAVPVPAMLHLCEDERVIGRAFMIMAHVQGRVFWDPLLPGQTREQRAAIYDELNRVLAGLHGTDYGAIGLGDYGRPGNYFARQIARWSRQYRASETTRIAAMDRLMAWLPEHIPEGEETTLVHGDYRMDNLIFHPTEPRALGLLDWELSTLGHPLADLAYLCMAWHIPPDVFRGIKGHDLPSLGIPPEQDCVEAYCRRTGRAGVAHWNFYLAYNLFRMAAIMQGIKKRALEGTAASENALREGDRAGPLAEIGWTFADGRPAS